MELEQTVGQQKEANWNWIQGEMEVFFSVWPSIVLDLQEINVDGSNITEFSNTLDESLINIKNKDKEKTAQSLAKLYNFLPDFINSTEMECIKKNAPRSFCHLQQVRILVFLMVLQNSFLLRL